MSRSREGAKVESLTAHLDIAANARISGVAQRRRVSPFAGDDDTTRAEEDGSDYGWFGILGLAGLAGLMGPKRDDRQRTDSPRR